MSEESTRRGRIGAFSGRALTGGVGLGFSIIKKLIDVAKERNRDATEEKTAPESVFDNIKDKLDVVKTQIRPEDTEEDIVRRLKDQVDEVKRENRDNPNEETAEDRLFDRIKDLFDNSVGKTEEDIIIDEAIEVDEFEGDDEFEEDDRDNAEIKAIKNKIKRKRKALNKKMKEMRAEVRGLRREMEDLRGKTKGELQKMRAKYIRMMEEQGRGDEIKKIKGKGKGKKPHRNKGYGGKEKGRKWMK